MSEAILDTIGRSKIQWTDYTGGPWLICGEVSPGCANCYARELLKRWYQKLVRKAYRLAKLKDWRTRPTWGPKAPRITTKGFADKILALDRKAARENTRYKIFPSMIDWLDDFPAGIIDQDGHWLDKHQVLADFLDLIRRTSNLDWLLLTKRPENFPSRMIDAVRFMQSQIPSGKYADTLNWLHAWTCINLPMNNNYAPPTNVWIGTTVENQEYADKRIPELLKIPAVCRFISYEPALGPVDFGKATPCGYYCDEGHGHVDHQFWAPGIRGGIHWVIIGGESGPKARPFNVAWAENTIEQCKAASVACFVKQLGASPVYSLPWNEPLAEKKFDDEGSAAWFDMGMIKDKKGGDITEWPQDLRVRQFPTL